jgi:hypothetical protein
VPALGGSVFDWARRLVLWGAKLAERRRAPRVDLPGHCFVVIEGNQYPLRNWSATGFFAAAYAGELTVDRTFNVGISVRQDNFDFVFDAEAVVVRRDAGGIAGRIVDVTPEIRRQIDEFFSQYTMWVRVNR